MRRFELENLGVNGERVELRSVLAQLSGNTLQWSIIRFIGAHVPPGALTQEQFQAAMSGAATGYLLSFDDLRRFATTVERTDDCFIMAAASIGRLTTYRLNRDFSHCAAVVQRSGDAAWQLWIHETSGLATRLPAARALMRVAEPPPPEYPKAKAAESTA